MSERASSDQAWAALRALRAGEPVTFELLAAATRRSAASIARRAEAEGWAGGGEHAALLPDPERVRRLLGRVMGLLESVRLPEGAEGWKAEKERIDLIAAMTRTVEKIDELIERVNRDKDEIEREDAEIGDVLRRIDDRIVELAQEYAEWLVAGQSDREAGQGRR